jgi:hypothetical protein
MNLGAGVGVALIDSGIHVNQDLTGNGTNSHSLANLFPNVSYAESFAPGEGVDDYATAPTWRESSRETAPIRTGRLSFTTSTA